MKKINLLTVAKVGGFVLGVISTGIATWASGQEQKKLITDAVQKELKK